ncbi:hypothetical protein M0R45_009537 [Rubus argutus]|uniref:MHC class I antigen n=1 Tax=Rubus argutus TaxID=59490 RepID=A0AAW1Y7T3_RUBAR
MRKHGPGRSGLGELDWFWWCLEYRSAVVDEHGQQWRTTAMELQSGAEAAMGGCFEDAAWTWDSRNRGRRGVVCVGWERRDGGDGN